MAEGAPINLDEIHILKGLLGGKIPSAPPLDFAGFLQINVDRPAVVRAGPSVTKPAVRRKVRNIPQLKRCPVWAAVSIPDDLVSLRRGAAAELHGVSVAAGHVRDYPARN